MNRTPWISLAATALLASVGGIGASNSAVLSQNGVFAGSSSSPIPITAPATTSIGSHNSLTINATSPIRVEWFDAETLALKYVPPHDNVATSALEGTLGVRKVGASKTEHLSFQSFQVQTAIVNEPPSERKDVNLVVSPIDLTDNEPKSLKIQLMLPPKCTFHPVLFNSPFIFTMLEEPPTCFPLQGLIYAENTTKDDSNKANISSSEGKLLSWSAPPPFSTDLQFQVLLVPAIWACSITLIALMLSWLGGVSPWSVIEGSPTWDFTQSWASNITLGGGLLAALVVFAGLNPIILRRATYSFFDLYAAALLTLGSAIFALFAWTEQSATGAVRRNRAMTFYIACCVVLWAALVQIRLVRLLVLELKLDRTLTPRIESSVGVTIEMISILLALQSLFSIVKTVRQQSARKGSNTVPAPEWPLL